MRFVIVDSLSEKGDGPANDDAFGHAATGAHADFWVIDGATSVADRTYVPGAKSDPQWFAENLSAEIASASAAGEAPVEALLRLAIGRVRDRYVAAVGGLGGVPAYAWPLASLTLVRSTAEAGRLAFAAHCLGDCPAFVFDGAWIPLWQPSSEGDRPAYLDENLDRAAMKERIRARRAEQHRMPAIGVVALDPECVSSAKTMRFEAGGAGRLVVMSDGFARLFQEYKLLPASEVMRQLELPGAASRLLARLRDAEKPEAAAGRPTIYKNGDDATVLSVAFGEARADQA